MIKIKTLKCEKGLYIHKEGTLNGYRLNGDSNLKVKPTFKPEWYLLEGCYELRTLECLGQAGVKDTYWELIDKEDNPLDLPQRVSKEEAYEWYDEDEYEWYIGLPCKYSKYRSLYKRSVVYSEKPWRVVDIEVINMGFISVGQVDNFSDMKVTLNEQSGQLRSENLSLDLSHIVCYEDLDEMLVPSIALHNRPCIVKSPQVYKLVRSYIKNNIDSKYAIVTSDYDFCFTVKKKIRVKPYQHKTEVLKSNSKSYAKPRFKSRTVTNKLDEVFEMTCSNKKYKGYTIIEDFVGENLQDLKDNIKSYLDTLMEVINSPLHECEHCNGMGAIVKPIGTNEGRDK